MQINLWALQLGRFHDQSYGLVGLENYDWHQLYQHQHYRMGGTRKYETGKYGTGKYEHLEILERVASVAT